MKRPSLRRLAAACALLLSLLLSPAARAASSHTITIDGVNDFAGDETFSGTSGSTWYVTWDANNLYFGLNASDVGSGSSTEFVWLYLDTDPQPGAAGGNGTSAGLTYNTQQPALPFNADYHFRWKADNTYMNLQQWNGSAWVDGTQTGIQAYQQGAFVEVRIPLANLGSPQQLYLTGGMLNEASGGEWTFFLLPATNSEGYDPDLSNYYGFVLVDGVSPNESGHENRYVTATTGNSADFGSALAWIGGNVPGSGAHASVRNGHTLVVSGGDFTVDGLVIQRGGAVQVQSGANLYVQSQAVNNGTLQITKIPSALQFTMFGLEDGGGGATYPGVEIQDTGSTAMGSTTVTIRGAQNCTTDGASAPVQRCFDIAPSGEPPVQGNVRLYYASSEANGNTETAAAIYHWNGTSWDLLGADATSTGGGASRWVQVNNVSAFSPFLVDDAAPTAITLTRLAARSGGGAGLPLAAGVFLMLTAGVWAWRSVRR